MEDASTMDPVPDANTEDLAGPAPKGDAAFGALSLARGIQLVVWLALLLISQRFWPEAQSGVFWGGLVTALNLWAMRLSARLSTRHLQGARQHAHKPRSQKFMRLFALAFAGKFVAMLVGTALIIEYAKPHPLGFLLGFATLLVGIMCAAPFGALGAKG